MLIVIGFAISLSACNNSPGASGEGIRFFEGNFSQALEKAAAENKLVFLDAHTDWCGYCRKMKRQVYSDKSVGEAFNAKFVSISVDMEKGEGPELAYRYGVSLYPTLFILDAQGNVVKGTKGFQSVPELLEFAR